MYFNFWMEISPVTKALRRKTKSWTENLLWWIRYLQILSLLQKKLSTEKRLLYLILSTHLLSNCILFVSYYPVFLTLLTATGVSLLAYLDTYFQRNSMYLGMHNLALCQLWAPKNKLGFTIDWRRYGRPTSSIVCSVWFLDYAV